MVRMMMTPKENLKWLQQATTEVELASRALEGGVESFLGAAQTMIDTTLTRKCLETTLPIYI